MRRWMGVGVVLAAGMGGSSPSWGQFVERERDVSVTGPGGRTLQRQVTTQRGPGFVDRQVQVQRPGGTFRSNVMAQRVPSVVAAPGRGRFPGPWGGYGPGPRYFGPREVIINRGGGGSGWLPGLAIGGGLFGLGMLAGSAVTPRTVVAPPPVVVAQPPVYVTPPPVIVAPTAGAQAPSTGVAMPPQVSYNLDRLRSGHDNSRRDGALGLGQFGDDRAVPALIDRLEHDSSREVRAASAWALGQIGDPRAGVALERAAMFDKRRDVRDAANQAYARIPRDGEGVATAARSSPTTVIDSTPVGEAPSRAEQVPPPPTPAAPPY